MQLQRPDRGVILLSWSRLEQ